MKHFGLIGEKLGHSLSAVIHEKVFERLDVGADYRLIEIPREELDSRLPALLRQLDGFNVTIPYKQAVIPFLKELDSAARAIGAVNTVCCGEASGHNTDAPGFAAMLRREGIDPAGRECFVLGNGGASRAVIAALNTLGASRVTLVSRRPEGDMISYGELALRFSGILVNCTPVGMWPKTEACPIPEQTLMSMLPRAEAVADVIYNPGETVLTRTARAAGVKACTGLYMLVAQALEADRIWLRREIPEDMTEEIMKELTF